MPEAVSEGFETSESDGKLTREFARRAAFAATTAVVVPATLLSQETAPKPTPAPGSSTQAATQVSPTLRDG